MKRPTLEVIDLQALPDDSLLIIKVDVAGPIEKYLAAQDLMRDLFLHKDVFQKKRITIMVTTPKEGVETLTPAEMERVGWVKKELHYV